MVKTGPETRVADAAFRLLARRAWHSLTLAEIARAAKISLADMFAIAPSKPALVALLLRRLGKDTARRYRPDRESRTPHDRLFDIALTWFESLAPHKNAVRSLRSDLARDPLTLLAIRADAIASAEWLLVLAEADMGSALPVRAFALAVILARAVPVWLEDDKELTRTMAKLDADLRRSGVLFRAGDSGKRGGKTSTR